MTGSRRVPRSAARRARSLQELPNGNRGALTLAAFLAADRARRAPSRAFSFGGGFGRAASPSFGCFTPVGFPATGKRARRVPFLRDALVLGLVLAALAMPGFSGAQEQEPDSREPAAEPQLELGLPGDDAPGARAPATSDGGFDPHAAFTEANRLFGGGRAKGDLAQAATLYRELLQRGYHNAHIHYNLGNTYLRLDDPGRAILHFRRALLYDPDHAYASHMLERAREHVTDRFEQEEDDGTLRTLFFWHFDTSSAQRKQAFLVFWVLLWVALIAGLATRYPFRRTIQVALVVVTAATGGSLLVERLLETGDPAVLVAREVVVRSGQGDEFEPVFQAPLRGGVEVRILARRDLWRQVRFPGGAVGWVPESAVAPIVPPAG